MAIDCVHEIVGAGPPIFFIHGIGARRSGWAKVVEALRDRYTCVSYDLRGHGDSPLPKGSSSLEDLVDDLEALRKKLEIEAAHFVGHSLGGMIGPAYARRFPHRVRTLGLLSTAAFRTEDDTRKVKAVVEAMRTNGIAETLPTMHARWFTDAFAAAHPEVVERRMRQVSETDAAVFLNVFDIYAETEMSPWLSEVSAPSLVLTGELDGGCAPRLNEQIARALPNAKLQILPGLKHAITLEAPQEVADALARFLEPQTEAKVADLPATCKRSSAMSANTGQSVTSLFINGQWRAGSSDETIKVLNPATEEVIGTVAKAVRHDLDAAVAAAQQGLAIWSQTSPLDRSRLMRRAASILRERKDDIAGLMTREQGKPLPESTAEIGLAADIIEWFSEEAKRTYGQVIPARATNVRQITIKEPVGVVAAFTPWNFPINQIVRKLSAALAAGCSIIVKGPEETPASPAELIRAFADAGLPAGVANLVFGEPAEISTYLISHPAIRKISFTGSTSVGKQLAALAGREMKRVTMELGGHAPVIIAADADLSKAVSTLGFAKFRNAGQTCISPTRFLVHESLYDRFLEGFVDYARGIAVGDGLTPGTIMGPLANARRVEALERLTADAVANGARLATGGRRIDNKGFYYEPTVLANVPMQARIMNEEPFGPVALINRFDKLDEAIGEANRLPFGLASYAFTRSLETAQELSTRIEAGMLTINHIGLSLPEVPFGGMKDSGYGTEGGSEAIEGYLTTRFVTSA